MKNGILRLGCTEVILKSDNGPGIASLLQKALALLCVESSIERIAGKHPKEHVSRSNGATASGVKSPREVYGTTQLHLEHRTGGKIPPRHPTSAWLIGHASMVLAVRIRGLDGKAPRHRIKGRHFGMRIACFGEIALFKRDAGGPAKAGRGNTSS